MLEQMKRIPVAPVKISQTLFFKKPDLPEGNGATTVFWLRPLLWPRAGGFDPRPGYWVVVGD